MFVAFGKDWTVGYDVTKNYILFSVNSKQALIIIFYL